MKRKNRKMQVNRHPLWTNRWRRNRQKKLLMESSSLLADIKAADIALEDVLAGASGIEDIVAEAHYFKDTILPAMDALRAPVDTLEMTMDKKMWPYPSYGDMLFEV